MLTPPKKAKMLAALKAYCKKFITTNLSELDESGTRLMINHFLTDILGYQSLEEVKTEYMIRGTYADYVVQTKGIRHFLVEVKALSFNLSDKHLRQAVNYGANEGIEWALLTNGRHFELYKILFQKPIDYKRVISIDLSENDLKEVVEDLQYLHKDAVNKKSLPELWNKYSALDPHTLAGLLFDNSIFGLIKRDLKKRYKCKFEDEDIRQAINVLISTPVDIDKVKVSKPRAAKKKLVEPVKAIVTELKEIENKQPE